MQIRFLALQTDFRSGANVTRERWISILEGLGHQVEASAKYSGEPCDVAVAFHAYKSAEVIRLFKEQRPNTPLVLCMTGTDLYRDIHEQEKARQSLIFADRLIVLQSEAIRQLPAEYQAKTRVIYQSAKLPSVFTPKAERFFDICVIGHLRDEKDPMRAAKAVRLLPKESTVRLWHVGKALLERYEQEAETEMQENSRYHWVGEKSQEETEAILTQSRLLVLSSVMEGGANVVSEAIVAKVPVIVSRIPCTIGLLGEGYPGFFSVGDTQAMSQLILRAEQEPQFLQKIAQWCGKEAYKFDPEREQESWAALLSTLHGTRAV